KPQGHHASSKKDLQEWTERGIPSSSFTQLNTIHIRGTRAVTAITDNCDPCHTFNPRLLQQHIAVERPACKWLSTNQGRPALHRPK
ncbi:MAG TPA: hypothetical protein VMG63_02655, partial [Terriglobia bacterium]|nr:hypothetical protein [Terriglobia bacterium]